MNDNGATWADLGESRYFIGVDLGQAQDFTAVSIVERRGIDRQNCKCSVGALYRYPLGTSYADVVGDLGRRLLRAPTNSKIIIDQTGVGRAVFDWILRHPTFAGRSGQIVGVSLHGGDAESHAGGQCYRVAKRDVVGAIQILLQSSRLKISADLSETPQLVHELQNFRVEINEKTAHDSYSAWRQGDHDDLVLSLGMACWAALHPRYAMVYGSAPHPRLG